MKRKLSLIISGFIFFAILFLMYKIYEDNQYQKKYNLIETQIFRTKLIKDWGNPLKEFVQENHKILMYEKGLGWEKYVFIFNPENDLLLSKHIDD